LISRHHPVLTNPLPSPLPAPSLHLLADNMPPKAPDGQTLLPKDDVQFKQMVKNYEQKQYKRALKQADTILKRYSDHGETLAMKGLILSNIDDKKKEEAYTLVKLGLAKNVRSHVCWHVYGLMYRQDRDYNQAIKCYRNALRQEPDNLSILRDLSLLQIQMRDLKNMTDTRQRLLELKPNAKMNWLSFALAHHMQGNYEVALAILDSYESTMGLPDVKYEQSEFLLYRAMLLQEGGKYQECVDLLKAKDDKITDTETKLTMRAQCEFSMEHLDLASQHYLALIERNPENLVFLVGLARCKGLKGGDFKNLSDEERKRLRPLFAHLREKHPKSKTITRVELDVLTGDEFREFFSKFMKNYLTRTVPTVGSAIKSFYADPEKVRIIGEVFEEFEVAVKKEGKLPGEEVEAHPLVLVWVWLARSNHALRLKDIPKAHEYVDLAIDHTPTIDHLHMHKAKVCKHEGKMEQAADLANLARKMDEADRYNNTKATRLLLRANKWEEAEKTIAMFAFRTPESESFANVVEMQIQWYELELGACYYRMGDVLSACRRYLLVDKHFSDFSEDAFDFHTYCLRKFTMRAYVDMLRNEDNAKGNKFYCQAAAQIVRCYLDLHRMGAEEAEAKVLPELTAAKAKKPKTKEQEEKDKDLEPPVDLKKPLEAAVRFLQTLQRFRPDELSTHLLAAELHQARGKGVQVLRALRCASALPAAAGNAELIKIAKEFFVAAEDLPADVKAVVLEQKDEILKAVGA